MGAQQQGPGAVGGLGSVAPVNAQASRAAWGGRGAGLPVGAEGAACGDQGHGPGPLGLVVWEPHDPGSASWGGWALGRGQAVPACEDPEVKASCHQGFSPRRKGRLAVVGPRSRARVCSPAASVR